MYEYDLPDPHQLPTEEVLEHQRLIRFYSAVRRVRRTGSPAARANMRDARLALEAHGQDVPDVGTEVGE